MIKQQTPIEKVTELLQTIKKLESAKELAYQLDQLLPSSLSKTQSETCNLYMEYGISPDPNKVQDNWVPYPAMITAKNSLFKNQENYLKACILEILGFNKETTQKVVSAE